MSDKQTEPHRVVLRLAESGQLAQLTKYMLALESRLQKYERVAAVAKDVAEIMKCDVGTLTGMHIDGCDKCTLIATLAELDQP